MLIKNSFWGLIRRPLITAVCVILLMISMVLSVLGETMSAVAASLKVEEEEYVEIAVITPQLRWKNSLDTSMVNAVRKMYRDVMEKDLFQQYTEMIDVRTFAGAHSAGIAPITFTEAEVGNCISWMHNQNFGVFVGRCTAVKANEGGTVKTYKYFFDVEQVVHLHEAAAWDETRSITLDDMTFESSGPMAEEGKTYLFWGSYIELEDSAYFLSIPINRTLSGVLKREEQNGIHVLKESGKGTGEFIPLISELNGSVEELMQSEIGALWQKGAMDRIEVCEHSLSVIGTDCLESVYTFNINEATVTEGQAFTAAQYESGERVCIISRELAQQNGLQVGDLLPLQVYCAQYVYDDPGILPSVYNIFDPYAGYEDEGDWRIVGLYDHDYEPGGEYDLHPNTVFVPNRSLKGDYRAENSSQYSDFWLSFILRRDRMEAFRLEAEAAGYGGMFIYNDGGRAEGEAQTNALQEQITAWQGKVAQIVKIIPILGAVLMAVAMLLFVMSQKREIGELYTIETMRGTLFAHFLLQSFVLVAVSGGLGTLACVLFVPALTDGQLVRLAESDFIVTLKTLLPEAIGYELSVIGERMMLLAIIAFFCAMIAAVRRYQFVYRERE